ncbi:MAG: hypothetical protein NTY20_04570 [Candidatus Aenigmarchaeota archaeon]|nr:hypothetical protein [Candidatus Aenigmarchaeota archaeon]
MRMALPGIAALFFVMLVSGCATQIACNPPYIVKGSGCCLDENNNRICDNDEGPGTPTSPVKTYGTYKVIMYIQQDSPEPDSWYKLPPSPARNFDGYQIYSNPANGSYYDGGWLLLYTNYMEEPISCSIKEYHDSAFYTQAAVKLTSKGYSGNISGVAIRAMFKKDSTPKTVRYDLSCHGDESGITFQDAYAVGLRPP